MSMRYILVKIPLVIHTWIIVLSENEKLKYTCFSWSYGNLLSKKRFDYLKLPNLHSQNNTTHFRCPLTQIIPNCHTILDVYYDMK